MPILESEKSTAEHLARGMMKAVVFRGPKQFQLEEKPIPKARTGRRYRQGTPDHNLWNGHSHYPG